MNQKKQLTILEFSRLTGIKRENLRFYDRVGLLSPDMRGENNYRYYSRHQLNAAYLISTLRGLEVSIEDIKRHAAGNSPENTLELFAQQNARVQAEIKRLQETSFTLQLYSNLLREALAHEKDAMFLEEKMQEPIYLCPQVPEGMDAEEGELFPFEYAEEHGVSLGLPYGAMIPQEKIGSGDVSSGRGYFRVGTDGNASKPAGLYAVAYCECDPWKTAPFHHRLLNFMAEQGLCTCGNAYEEYPLGDFVAQEADKHCVRVEIPVMRAVP